MIWRRDSVSHAPAPACHAGATRAQRRRRGRAREGRREDEVPDGRRAPPQRRRRGERDEHDEGDLDGRVEQQRHFFSTFPAFPALPAPPAPPAFFTISPMRSSSSSESRAPSPPSSAATAPSADPSKNVSTRWRRADLPGGRARHGRDVDVLEALLFVADVALFLEHAQLRPHGRVRRGARERLHHVPGRRAALPVEDVHDLALAAAQRGRAEFGHLVISSSGHFRSSPQPPAPNL